MYGVVVHTFSKSLTPEKLEYLFSSLGKVLKKELITKNPFLTINFFFLDEQTRTKTLLLSGLSLGGSELVVRALPPFPADSVLLQNIECANKSNVLETNTEDSFLAALTQPATLFDALVANRKSFSLTWKLECTNALLAVGFPLPPEIISYLEQQLDRTRRTVFVSNLSESVSEPALKRLFVSAGSISQVFIKRNPSRSVTLAFIEFYSKTSAIKALVLNGHTFLDNELKVVLATNPIIRAENNFPLANKKIKDLTCKFEEHSNE